MHENDTLALCKIKVKMQNFILENLHPDNVKKLFLSSSLTNFGLNDEFGDVQNDVNLTYHFENRENEAFKIV